MRGAVIEVKTSMPAGLLTRLAAEGVKVGQVSRFKGGVRFTVSESNIAKTFAFLENLCYTYSVAENTGSKATLKKAIGRAGLAAGMAAVLAAYAVLSGRIWRIDVAGNELLSDKAVIELLAEQGVTRGAGKRIDLSALESAMRAYPQLSECSLSLHGTTLTVTVIESTKFDDPTETAPSDIVSGYDATITRVVCERGTARVRPGDRVSAGAMLIEGATYSTAADDYGNPVLLGKCRAGGEVYGAVVFARHLAVPVSSVEYVRTGRKTTRSQLKLFGLKIGKLASPYATFDAVTDTDKLAPVPIRCTRTTYYETEAVTRETDGETVAADAIRELTTQADLSGATVLSETHTVTSGNGLLYIHCYVTAEMPIGERK